MKTMIWKELRENVRWAALGFLCLLLAETYALSTKRTDTLDAYYGITLCGATFLLVSAFGCALIGAALGAVQLIPELRRDQWASLLHRPVPRGVIFFGKAVAGLSLYAVATGIPLLISIAHAAWPGAFAAPFVPGLALPAVSDLFLGVAFYCAALLLALHPGRWCGARGAIALCAVAVLVLHLADHWPFALPIFAAALFLAAGWGAMLGSTRHWVSRLALGCVILVGCETALLPLGAFIEWLPQKPAAPTAYSDFRISSDGRVLVLKDRGGDSFKVTDADGTAITEERYAEMESSGQFLSPVPLAYRRGAAGEAFLMYVPPRSSWTRLQLMNRDSEGPELWYLVCGPQSHFAGYDKLSRRCIGICDAGGFHDPAAALQPFASEHQDNFFSDLYWVGSELFGFDFTEWSMTPLFDAGGETMGSAVRFPNDVETSKYIAVALRSGVRILDLRGAPLLAIPYSHEAVHWPNVEITSTDDLSRIFLKYGPRSAQPGDENLPTYLDEIDAQGHLVRTHKLLTHRFRITPPTWRSRIVRLLAPPFPAIAATLWERAQPPRKMPVSDSSPGLIQDLTDRELAGITTVAVALGLVALHWARRANLSAERTATWVVLTIVFGAAGLLTYRLASDWPTRVRCPRCAHKRPVRADFCPHCREPWKPAPSKGAEIFESSAR